MVGKKLSTGFAGASTRGMGKFEREVETRMSKHLDTFTDEFSPPYSRETFPGADFTKRSAPYEAKHSDHTPESDPQFWDKSIRAHPEKHLHSAGDPRDQEKMDWLDGMENKIQAPIKKEPDQFPGAVDIDGHKEIAGFDKHQTDPMRLKKEITMPYESKAQQGYMHVHHPKIAKEWDKESKGQTGLPYHKQSASKVDGPESFHKEVEGRLTRMNVTEHPKQPDPKWNSGKNPDQTMSKKKLASEPEGRKTKTVNGTTYFWSDYLGKWYARD